MSKPSCSFLLMYGMATNTAKLRQISRRRSRSASPTNPLVDEFSWARGISPPFVRRTRVRFRE